jgi:hypothetical protein
VKPDHCGKNFNPFRIINIQDTALIDVFIVLIVRLGIIVDIFLGSVLCGLGKDHQAKGCQQEG